MDRAGQPEREPRPPEGVELEERLRGELVAAMRARDRPVSSALRATLGRLADAEAVPAPERVGQTESDRPWAPVESVHVAGSVEGWGATEVPRRELTEAQRRAILAAERAELLEHVERLTRLCRWDEADGARRAADVLARVVAGPPRT